MMPKKNISAASRRTYGLLSILLLLALVSCRPEQNAAFEEQSPGVDHPDTAGFRVITREELDPPEPAFDFTLSDQSGESVSLSDYKGQIVLLGFLYTNCPEACPIVAANFVQIRRHVADEPNASDLVQFLVSTDPERDTQNRRNVYTRGIGGDWFFVSGELEEVAKVWDAYDIYREVQDRNLEVVVYHSYRTYLIDRDGQIRYEYVGVWHPDDIKPDVVALLAE